MIDFAPGKVEQCGRMPFKADHGGADTVCLRIFPREARVMARAAGQVVLARQPGVEKQLLAKLRFGFRIGIFVGEGDFSGAFVILPHVVAVGVTLQGNTACNKQNGCCFQTN